VRAVLAASAACVLAGSACAASLAPPRGGLSDLFLPRRGKLVQYSSRALKPGGLDGWEVGPGQTVTLVDRREAGIVRRWWMTVNQHAENPLLFRQLVLRCYWDGERDPSVEAPLSDFFGLGFGEWHDYHSIPVSATSGGFNCSWPMPFRSAARITVENRSTVPVTALYFNIGVETGAVPGEALYFHAQFRRVAPTRRGEPVTVLETTGSGQYVGTVLSARALRGSGLRFLEGNEMFYVDGESQPSVVGTGTEDYFGAGLYAVTGPFAAGTHGVTIVDPAGSRFSGYRWHIEDPVPFTRSLRFVLQHGQYANETPADYATLAIWYQTHPHAPFPRFPDELGVIQPRPAFRVPGIIEAESLAAGCFTSGGSLSVQSMSEFGDGWSGDAQLWWRGAKVGDHLTMPVHVDESKEYGLEAYVTRSADYGDARVLCAGKEIGRFRGYHPEGIPSGPIPLGRLRLEEGTNYLLFEVTGKDDRATGYNVGIDGIRLTP